jgi:predicted ATP-binding protein involved in virulence
MTEPTSSRGLRVQRIAVEGLFGLYNHTIELNREERITIIHGPNGVGKTVLFKLTDALLNGRTVELLRYPFRRFEVGFSDGARLTVRQDEQNPKDKFVSFSRLGQPIIASSRFGQIQQEALIMAINHRLPLQPVAMGQWRDMVQDDVLDAWGVLDRYGYVLSEADYKNIQLPRLHDLPLQSYLIAAQRLIHLGKASRERVTVSGVKVVSGQEALTAQDTVQIYSEKLRDRIEQDLAEYGRKAQQLDQSFPQRLLQGSLNLPDESEIRAQMAAVIERQERYQRLGLIADSPQPHGAHEQLDEGKRTVMAVYLADMAKKLAVLDDLAKRVEVLFTQVNSQFVNKKLVLNEQHELAVKPLEGELLPISVLSSGEQHQIVLMFDLLFHVKPNTLVMIDEPELSLHIDWQERFVDNLRRIIEVANFDVVLATHSPYIVNGHNDLLVELSAKPVGVVQAA